MSAGEAAIECISAALLHRQQSSRWISDCVQSLLLCLATVSERVNVPPTVILRSSDSFASDFWNALCCESRPLNSFN
ncbi:hypothetical protein AHAS_Ahas08G0158900 [Arachis hypogaea]